MKKFFCALTILIIFFPMSVHADEMSEFKSQIEELKQQLQLEREENQRFRMEAEQRQAEFDTTIQAFQKKLEMIASKQEENQILQKEAEMAEKSTESKPKYLFDLLRKSRAHLPEREAQMSSGRDGLKRKTPSGVYADPSSFFFTHGYVTATYADFEKELGTNPKEVPQILIAGTSPTSSKVESGFRNDTALFIGSELTQDLSGVFEIHLVGNARDPVITESKFTWSPIKTEDDQPSLRFIAGRYWLPFGIHNREWFSAVNSFNLVSPVAAEVVPPHVNEVGVIAEGEWAISEDFGINYLVSIGNGPVSFELSDNVGGSVSNQFDHDSSRFFTSRVGVFPWIDGLNIGFNVAQGDLRQQTDTSLALTDAKRFEADLQAYGIDGTYQHEDLSLSGYYYFSEEGLCCGEGLENTNSLDRSGGTIEMLYTFLTEAPLLKEVTAKFRASSAKDATISDGTFRRTQYGLGVNARPHEHFLLKAEYFIHDEDNISKKNDNGFTLSGTVEF